MHLSDCSMPPLYWFSKLDPLASHVQMISKSICIPSSNISIDEMITRFLGRSMHTVRIKNKPTPEGYIFSPFVIRVIYTPLFLLHEFKIIQK